MKENFETISQWADETFGPSTTNLRIATRANKEMGELLTALSINDSDQKAVEECADIHIVLCRIVRNLGGNFDEAIERKMQINREREWELDGSGHGQHK